ncbi:hypothetical protein MO867_15985, partial [Microbulbifer sp. OS29]
GDSVVEGEVTKTGEAPRGGTLIGGGAFTQNAGSLLGVLSGGSYGAARAAVGRKLSEENEDDEYINGCLDFGTICKSSIAGSSEDGIRNEQIAVAQKGNFLRNAFSRVSAFFEASTLRGSFGVQPHVSVKVPGSIQFTAKTGASAGSTISGNLDLQGYDVKVEAGAVLTIPGVIDAGLGEAEAGYRWGPGYNNRSFTDSSSPKFEIGVGAGFDGQKIELSAGKFFGMKYTFDVDKFYELTGGQ